MEDGKEIQIDRLTYEQLMNECHITDAAEFRRILRTSKLPPVSSRRTIERKQANLIVKRITGQPIDWAKYKTQQKDADDGGPLTRKTSQEAVNSIEAWYQAIVQQGTSENIIDKDRLLGIACEGGFLQGPGDSEFVACFDPGINVIIGDRGTGKSTALNLAGVMADSVREETQVLIKRLLNLLSPVNKQEEISGAVRLSHRALRVLRFYSIKKYANFFSIGGVVYCYYVDVTQRAYEVLAHHCKGWQPVENIDQAMPSILFLEQGEVIRIAEEREEDQGKLYLNTLLDAIYPDLYRLRMNLAQEIKNLSVQFEHTHISYHSLDCRGIELFLDERFEEIRQFSNDLTQGEISVESARVILGYIDRYFNYKNRQPEEFWKDKPLLDYLTEKDDDVLYYLYIGPISRSLGDKLRALRQLREQAWRSPAAETSSDPGPFSPSSEEQIEDDVDSQDTEDSELLWKAYGSEQSKSYANEMYRLSARILASLRRRLSALNSWSRIFKPDWADYNDALDALARGYQNVVKTRIAMIKAQEEKCRAITKALNKKDDLEIRIFTLGAQEIIQELLTRIQDFPHISSFEEKVLKTLPNFDMIDLEEIKKRYDNAIESLLNALDEIGQGQLELQPKYLYNRIKIELLQGSSYRDFQQLSFGQKTGIILKMVLDTTDKWLVLIDQPEDNLDTFSIVNIIAPTLNRIGAERQVVLVTHNSNLVMALDVRNLIALESLGENAQIKLRGPLFREAAVQELFGILEGGLNTFWRKMTTYEEFISQIGTHVRDADLQNLEVSFRQRTIDDLRNYLQPLVSDGSLLDFLRHQLKQLRPDEFKTQIQEFGIYAESLEKDSSGEIGKLLELLNTFSNNLDAHLVRFLEAINEIRRIDTQPNPTQVDLYTLLHHLKNAQTNRLIPKRDIRIMIDERLRDYPVWADEIHLKLVFRNLISNALTATESRVFEALRKKQRDHRSEEININLDEYDDHSITLHFQDNGCGMPKEILERLYCGPCSTKPDTDHGVGGVIISKLLELNQGKVVIVESHQSGAKRGTLQSITLRRENHNEKDTDRG
jgi:signal transduction histidine kinase